VARLVLAGIGDLNKRVARRWAASGGDVVAMRKGLVDSALTVDQIPIDLATQQWPDLSADYMVVALSAKTRSLEGYQQAYLEPLKLLRLSMADWSTLPKRIIVVSSTRVFGENGAEIITDTSQASSLDPYADILLNMEDIVESLPTSTCIARLSGIYSRDRDWLIRMARRADQELPKTNHWTNRIHVEDAASALIHLLNLETTPKQVIVTDTRSMPLFDVLNYLRSQESLPVIEHVPPVAGGKRLDPQFLKDSGFRWQFPTAFSGGYQALS
jgi:nucleoside-diphosphate-sugar epimerase